MRLFGEGPSYSEYGTEPTTPVRPYRAPPAIYVAPPPTPKPPKFPMPEFVLQQSPVPVSIQIQKRNEQIVKSLSWTEKPAENLYADLVTRSQALDVYRATPTSFPGANFRTQTIQAPKQEHKISMDQAVRMVQNYINQVSWGAPPSGYLNIRAANEKLKQIADIGKAIQKPGYTVQERPASKGGGYVVVPTKQEANVPTAAPGPVWRGISWETVPGTSVAVGVEPFRLPDIQRQLLYEAIGLVRNFADRPPPRLPEIQRPAAIARSR